MKANKTEELTLTRADDCSKEWNRSGNPRSGRTRGRASSHGYRFRSCKYYSVSHTAALFCSLRTRCPPHLSSPQPRLPNIPNTSATKFIQLKNSLPFRKIVSLINQINTHVKSSDNSGRISADELKLHAEPPESVTLFRLKPTTYKNIQKQ